MALPTTLAPSNEADTAISLSRLVGNDFETDSLSRDGDATNLLFGCGETVAVSPSRGPFTDGVDRSTGAVSVAGAVSGDVSAAGASVDTGVASDAAGTVATEVEGVADESLAIGAEAVSSPVLTGSVTGLAGTDVVGDGEPPQSACE